MGSDSQSGGVNQTNARMAITMRSYCHVVRSNVQKSVFKTTTTGNILSCLKVMEMVLILGLELPPCVIDTVDHCDD